MLIAVWGIYSCAVLACHTDGGCIESFFGKAMGQICSWGSLCFHGVIPVYPRINVCFPSQNATFCFHSVFSPLSLFPFFLFLPLVRKISLLPFRETIASRWFCTTEVAVLTFSYLLGRLALQASIPDQKASFSSFCKLLLNINGLCLIINQEVLPYDTVK